MTSDSDVDISVMSTIAKIHRAFQREMNRRLATLNITYLDFLILKATKEGETTMAKLAKRFFVTQSAITAAVDRLEELGMVTRGRSLEDRRIITVAITDSGLKAFYQGMDIYQGLAREILKRFEGKEELLATLRRILEIIDTLHNK